METAYRRAWLAFLETSCGIADPTTLGAGPGQKRYLENRLQEAFAAGWRDRSVAEPPTPVLSTTAFEGALTVPLKAARARLSR